MTRDIIHTGIETTQELYDRSIHQTQQVNFLDQFYFNGCIINWILHQIFIFSNNFKIAAAYNIEMPPPLS